MCVLFSETECLNTLKIHTLQRHINQTQKQSVRNGIMNMIKVKFRAKCIKGNKEGHFLVIWAPINNEDMTLLKCIADP